MDKSTLRHRLSVVTWDEWNLHAFVRGDDGNVEHHWPGDGDIMFGPEDLGGAFATDPIATFGPGGLHLVGRVGAQLVGWVWPAAGQPALLGAPQELVLPGLAVADPDVVVAGGALHVFAPSLDGQLRRRHHLASLLTIRLLGHELRLVRVAERENACTHRALLTHLWAVERA